MDILCERCKTEYEFDDAQITEQGVTVKCSTCGNVFKVRRQAVITTEASPAAASGGGAAGRGRDWMIRKEDGRVLAFRELTTLQKWIVEKRVTRNDMISRSGDTWKKLGEIPELAAFFSVVGGGGAGGGGDDMPTMQEHVPEGVLGGDEASTRRAAKPVVRNEATMELSDGDVEGLEGPTRPDERPLPAEAYRPELRHGAVPTLRGMGGGGAAVGLAAAPKGMGRASAGPVGGGPAAGYGGGGGGGGGAGAPHAIAPTLMGPPSPSGPRIQPAPSAAVVAAAAAHSAARKATGPRPAAGAAGAGAGASPAPGGASATGTGSTGTFGGAAAPSAAVTTPGPPAGARRGAGPSTGAMPAASASGARNDGGHEIGDLGVVGDVGSEPSFDMGGPPSAPAGRRSGPISTVGGGGPAPYTARFREDSTDDLDEPERAVRGRGGKMMAVVVILLALGALGGGGVYLFSVKPPWFVSLLGGLGGIVDSGDTAALAKLAERGKALAALDTDSDLGDAIEVFEKAQPDSDEAPRFAPALGAEAETYAIWASHLLDDAALLRRLVKDAAAKAAVPATAAPATAAADGAKKKKGAPEPPPATAAPAPAAALPTVDPAIADGLEKDGKEKLEKARDLATDALAIDAKQPDALRAMALYHLLSGDLDKMKDALDVVLEGAPEEPGALAVLGLSYLGDPDQTEKAEKMLRKALAGNKDLLRAHYYLARVYFDAKRPDDARKELRKLLDMNASHERASRLLEALDGDLEGFAAAVRAGKGAPGGAGKGPDVAPGTAAPSTALASAAPTGAPVTGAATGGPATATGSVAAGTGAGKPDDGTGAAAGLDGTVAKAAKLLEDGNTKAAEKLFKKALDAAPENLEALTGLAYCYLDLGSVSSAAAMFKRALAVNPTHGESIIGYARALSAAGDFAGAAREYNHYLELYPSGPLARGAKFQLEKLAPKLAPHAVTVDGTSAPATSEPAPPPPPPPASGPSE